MAADWIKMRTDLYRDPKVSVIAEILMDAGSDLSRYVNQFTQRDMTVTRNVMRNVTVGALVSVWGVMRTRGKRENDDLTCKGVSVSVLDDIADLPGFGSAMCAAGWVEESEQGIVFPRFFSDHNVDPEESLRKKNAERQARYRAKNSNVTDNVTVTHREEKRREDKKHMSGNPDCLEVLNYLNQKAKREYRAVDSNLRLIAARLGEGATVSECKAVVDAKVKAWSDDEKMSQYLRPETLFNATKFAQYVGELGMFRLVGSEGFIDPRFKGAK